MIFRFSLDYGILSDHSTKTGHRHATKSSLRNLELRKSPKDVFISVYTLYLL